MKTITFHANYLKLESPLGHEITTIRSRSYAKRAGIQRLDTIWYQSPTYVGHMMVKKVEERRFDSLTDAECQFDANSPERTISTREEFRRALNKWFARAGGIRDDTILVVYTLEICDRMYAPAEEGN